MTTAAQPSPAAVRAGEARVSHRWRARVGWALATAAIVLACAVLGLLIGVVHIGPIAVLRDIASHLPLVGVTSPLTDTEQAILWQVRLPRVVLAGLVGGMLALGGAAYQGAFSNPLADPYLLGVAAGAGLGATVAIVFARGVTLLGIPLLPVAAFIGGTAAVAMAYGVGRSVGAGRNSTTLILGGVAVASFLTALQTFLQQSDTDTLRDVYDWILGRLTVSGWSEVLLVLPYVAVSTTLILLHGRLLDVLGLGDEAADALGVRAGRTRLWIVGAVTLGTAAAVAVSGLIGFVGIIVPHAIRLLGGSSYRRLLPLSAAFGAAFLILCDLASRTVLSPAELPIGVVTAAIGAPFFAVVLRSSRRGS